MIWGEFHFKKQDVNYKTITRYGILNFKNEFLFLLSVAII